MLRPPEAHTQMSNCGKRFHFQKPRQHQRMTWTCDIVVILCLSCASRRCCPGPQRVGVWMWRPASRPPLCSQATATQYLILGRIQPTARLPLWPQRRHVWMVRAGFSLLNASVTLKRTQIISLSFCFVLLFGKNGGEKFSIRK